MNKDIEATAAKWAARVDRGPLPPDEQRELDEWLKQDRRRLGAFARARAVSAHFDRAIALGTTFDHRQFRDLPLPKLARGARLALIGGLAAGLMAIVLVIMLRTPPGQFSTSLGEVRIVPLSDGSAVTLNTATKLDVNYSKAERKVDLLEGEALFNVAKDRARPFIVRAGDMRIRAVGTSFTVRRLSAESVRVLVREGVVDIIQGSGPNVVPIHVGAQAQAVSQTRAITTTMPVPAPQIERQLAWQQGMISLDGMTLREAAAEFGRYSSTRIIIEDPLIADRTVTGLFASSNPVGFARAVATSMGLKAEVGSHSVRLTR